MHGDGQWEVPGYSAIRELGRGAAGRVVLARRDQDGAEVAIKYLSDELRSDVGFVARFRHEARLLGTLRSPYNARLIEYVETGAGAAIVMELVNGVSLRQVLRSEGPTGPEAALTVLKGSLKGLAAAHAIGVVHRDFKPENVVVQGDGASKLVDFGIAVRSGEGAAAAGTPPYMAPEQWSGAPAAPATDVYAATVVFFECLTGARPFRATNLAALARQHQVTSPPVEEVPAPLRGLVERGLAKETAERPPSAEAFLTELEAVAAEAYGPNWEERGRRRLAALAGLLVMLFPNVPETPEAQTSFGETTFAEPSRLLAKLSSKILIGTACIGVLVGVTMVTVNAFDDDASLRAKTSEVAPTSDAPVTPEPVEDPTDDPTEDPGEETAEPTPSVEDSTPAEPAPKPSPSKSAVAPVVSKTPKPSKTPTLKATPTPVRTTKKPVPSQTPVLELTGTVDSQPGVTTPPAPPPTSATARPTRTTAPPTQTGRPTTTPTSPPPVDLEPGRESGPASPEISGSTDGDGSEGAGVILALGLVTSGGVPVTLAVRRRMAGRHRRKR